MQCLVLSTQHAGDWLCTLPITSCGLKLSDEANICEPHACTCAGGVPVTAKGEHGLSCQLGFGRVARHGAVNDLIYRAFSKTGFPTIKEPQGLLRSDGKDRMVSPLFRGKPAKVLYGTPR